MRITMMVAALTLAGLSACSADRPSQAAPAPMPGSDRDAHGCIASAGYVWCARTDQCERPWELAESHAFENSAQDFEAFCTALRPR